jgi:hypothetical protein
VRTLDGVQASTCFHSGFFVQKELSQFTKATTDPSQAAQNAANLSTYVNDFCDNYSDILPQRTKFVDALKEISDQTAFAKACFAAQDEKDGFVKNAWFDPIDP